MKEVIVTVLGANSPSLWKVSIVSVFVLLFSILSITSDGNARKGNTLVMVPRRKKNKLRTFLEHVFLSDTPDKVEITGPVKLVKPILTIQSDESNYRGMELLSHQNACLKKAFPPKSHIVHVTSLAPASFGMPTEVQVRDLVRQVEHLRQTLRERDIDLRARSEFAEESETQRKFAEGKLNAETRLRKTTEENVGLLEVELLRQKSAYETLYRDYRDLNELFNIMKDVLETLPQKIQGSVSAAALADLISRESKARFSQSEDAASSSASF